MDSPGRGRRRAAHRLRECGEPVPGARGRTSSGIRDACGAWRESWPHRARAAVGERGAGTRGRSGRRGARPGRDGAAANDRACGAAACRRHRHRCDSLAVHPLRLGAERSSCSACLRSCDSGSPSLTALKEGGRSASDAPGRHRTRNALVVGQVALALTLLIVSGLMIRTFIAMRQVDPGFARPEEVQTFVLAIPPGLIADPQAGGAHARARRGTAGSSAGRHLRWPLVFHHDGRRG